MKKSTKRLAIGTAVAAAAGYVTGLLTAPKSGKETRQDIQKAAVKAKTEAEKNLKKLHSELDDLIEKSKNQADRLTTKARTEMNQAIAVAKSAKDKARELLSALHEGNTDNKELDSAMQEIHHAAKHLKTFLKKRA